jgi:nicotinamidase-related amidase
MTTVREGNKEVLLVVDVQVGVMDRSWDAERIIKNVARAVERARPKVMPVVWVQHSANGRARCDYGRCRSMRWMVTLSPSLLSIVSRRSALIGSLCVPSPRAMKELRKG